MKQLALALLAALPAAACVDAADDDALPEDGLAEHEAALDVILACPTNNYCDDKHMIIGCDERAPKPFGVNASTTSPWRHVGRLSNGCTGTLIGDRWVLTAAHCVKGVNTPLTFSLAQVVPCQHPNGRALVDRTYVPAAFVGNDTQSDRALDYALLELYAPIAGAQPMNVDYLSWATIQNKAVYSIGYPGTDQPGGQLYSTGTSAFGASPNRYLQNGEKGLLETDIDAEGGQSGAPVYVIHGGVRTVVGVLVGAPEAACEAGKDWASRMTPGAIEHIENAMSPNTIDFFWDWTDLPASPLPPPC